MKRMALAFTLIFASSLALAGGCWQNGKYVSCPKHIETPTEQSAS